MQTDAPVGWIKELGLVERNQGPIPMRIIGRGLKGSG